MNWRKAATALLWALPLAFLALFFFYPLTATFRAAGRAAWVQGVEGLSWSGVLRPLGFTLWQAALSMLVTLLAGLPCAYVFARYRFRGRGLLGVLITLPFILPTVVAAAGFNALLGPRGLVNLGLMSLFHLEVPPLQVFNTFGAILLAHVFYNTTIVIRMVGNAWQQLDPRLEQAARTLGASPMRAWREVTFPLLRPSILAAALLVFIFDFTSFGVVLLMGGPRFATLEVEIYIQAMQMLNLPLAGVLSLIQLGFTLLLTFAYSRVEALWVNPLAPRLQGEGMKTARTWKQRLLVGAMVAFLALLLLSPLAALAVRSVTRLDAARGERGAVQSGFTLDYYRELFINRRGSLFYVPPAEAVKNSLSYAGTAVVISLGLGMMAAYALRGKGRCRQWLNVLLMLPLGASAVTLGLGFVLAFSRPPLEPRSFPLLVPIAHSLVALPFVVRSVAPALASIPRSLREAAGVMGASPFKVWLEVELPIVGRAALAGGVFAFTISLGEFGATTFLARPESPTLPLAIFRFLSQPGAMNYGQSLAMSTILMVLCALGVWVVEKLRLPGSRGGF